MNARKRAVRLRTLLVASATLTLLLLAGCGSGSQGEPSYSGPASASEAPIPETPQDNVTTVPDIVTTGSVRMTVADPSAAADAFAAATTDAGGRVESRTDQSGGGVPTVDMTLRIPSDEVDAVLANIDELGNVESRSINYDDVTSQRVDLDARIKALQTSVNRLLDLMSKATSTEALLAAESSLTERQAELDSLQAQRATLGDQIAYATITVNLSSEPTVSRSGFVGSVEQGWQALVSVASGFTHVVGFLLPWTPVFLVIGGGFFWLIRRAQRRPAPVPSGWAPPPAGPANPVEPAKPAKAAEPANPATPAAE